MASPLLPRLAIGAAAILIALVTLSPWSSGGGSSGLCIFCGDRGLADFVLNVGLFVPFGASLAWLGWRVASITILAAAFSGAIEIAQFSLVPGRDATVGDLLANSLGGLLGGLIVWHWREGRLATRPPRMRSFLALGFVAAAFLTTLALRRPAPPDSTYYAQWAARLAHLEAYEGRVVYSRIGSLDVSGAGEIAEGDLVADAIRDGAAIRIGAMGGPSPRGLAPIFSVYDDHQREVLLLGIDDGDFVYRYRTVADLLRLDGGDLRWFRALSNARPGELLELAVWRDGRMWCMQSGPRTRCDGGVTVGDGWMLLYYVPGLPSGLRSAASVLWLIGLVPVLLLPLGVRVDWSGALGLLGIVWIGPYLMGHAMTPMWQVGCVAAGLGVSVLLLRGLRRVFAE